MHATSRQLGTGVLPQKFPFEIETQEHTQINGFGITFEVRVMVVRADINLAIRDNRVAIGSAAEFCFPEDILAGLDVPRCRNIFARRCVVFRRPAPPLRPIAGLDLQLGQFRHGLLSRILIGKCDMSHGEPTEDNVKSNYQSNCQRSRHVGTG